jgi:hypothetical protein
MVKNSKEKTYDSVDNMFDEIKREIDAQPLIEKIAYFIKYRVKDLHYHGKEFFQRLFRGYSNSDIWNLNTFLAKKIYKYLKIYYYKKRNGYPTEFSSFEEWNIVLKKMLFAMKETARWYPTEDKIYKIFLEEKAQERIKEYWKRIEEGCRLFGKYFGSLWD